MATGGPTDVVIDTSTLINFLRIDRVDLLAGLTSYRFVVTDHVRHEVTSVYPVQLSVLEFALLAGHLHVLSVDGADPVFLEMARQNLGAGECAAIAAACGPGVPLAMDDRRARNRALAHDPGLSLMDTASLVVAAIHAGLLTVPEADAIKADWEANHRFRLKFPTFGDLV
jgi:predicted nucleic acid-binding protein